MASRVRPADLRRPLGEVARETAEWQAGDPRGAVEETLAASSRSLHDRAYVFWAWTGADRQGAPVILTPVRPGDAAAFHPKGPAQALVRAVTAAVWSGASARRLTAVKWRDFVGLSEAGIDGELVGAALAEAHARPARGIGAALPRDVTIEVALLDLGPAVPSSDLAIAEVAYRAGLHPIRAAAALADLGIPDEQAGAYGPEILAALLGAEAQAPEPARPPPPSLDIADDPCPRRRHARRVLRRLLGMKKVGPGHHTAFDHIYRGAPADARHEAIDTGEALIRAGLLGEKPSVGQRHVYLRREALPQIHALIERGETDDPELAALWTESL